MCHHRVGACAQSAWRPKVRLPNPIQTMSLPQAYVRQRDDYLKYLRQFLPWVNISSLALIAYRPQDLLRPPSAKHNFFSRIIREGLSPEENQLGVLLASKNEPLWRTKKVPKRNGGTRVLHIPNVLLKHLQRATLFLLEKDNRLKYHRCATAFRPTNSVLANAKHHSRPGTLIRLDIRNFFPSITADRIASLLKSKHVHPRLASLQAALMTHKGRLPQGAPSSPPLSNAVCSAMDDKLNRFAMAHKLRYTRYADDMVFSSKRVLTRAEAREIVFQARMRVAAYGFRINLKKRA